MDRDESQGRDGADALLDHPGPEELQARVDATEDDLTARYRRLQDYTCLVSDALRHADAMSRLDLALRQPSSR